MCNLDGIRINTQNHLVSTFLTTQRIITSCSPRTIESRIKEDCKRIWIDFLVPMPTLAMLIPRVTVPALAFTRFAAIICLFPRDAMASLRACWIPKLVSPYLQSGIEPVAMEVVAVHLRGVAVSDDAKLLAASSDVRPWLGESGFECACAARWETRLLGESVVDHGSVCGYIARSPGASLGRTKKDQAEKEV